MEEDSQKINDKIMSILNKVQGRSLIGKKKNLQGLSLQIIIGRWKQQTIREWQRESFLSVYITSFIFYLQR